LYTLETFELSPKELCEAIVLALYWQQGPPKKMEMKIQNAEVESDDWIEASQIFRVLIRIGLLSPEEVGLLATRERLGHLEALQRCCGSCSVHGQNPNRNRFTLFLRQARRSTGMGESGRGLGRYVNTFKYLLTPYGAEKAPEYERELELLGFTRGVYMTAVQELKDSEAAAKT